MLWVTYKRKPKVSIPSVVAFEGKQERVFWKATPFYIGVCICVFAFTNFLLNVDSDPHYFLHLSGGHRRSYVEGDDSLAKVNFTGFAEQREGWLSLSRHSSPTEIRMQVSVYVEVLKLTPTFDISKFEITDLENLGDSYCRLINGGKTIYLQAGKYVNDGPREQEFLVNFGDLYANMFIIFKFDRLDFGCDPKDWIGFGDRDNRLGKGGYGVVYEVMHRKYAINCSMKQVQATRRYKNEIDLMELFRNGHNMINYYGSGMRKNTTKGAHYDTGYILAELMDGDAWHLFYKIRKKVKRKQITQRQFNHIVQNATQAIIDGMVYMRSFGYAHLDFKTQNLLYREVGEHQYHFKTTDFGTSKKELNTFGQYNKHSRIVTTWPYRSPQQGKHGKKYDGRLDQYSVGSTIFELFAGRFAWTGPTRVNKQKISSEIYLDRIDRMGDFENCEYCFERISIPDSAKDLIYKLMKYNPEDRIPFEEANMHPFLSETFYRNTTVS